MQVAQILRKTGRQAECSVFNFHGALRALGLLEVAKGKVAASAAQQEALARAVQRWVQADEPIVASLCSTFGLDGGSGTDMLEHVRRHFLAPMVQEADDAERALEAYDCGKQRSRAMAAQSRRTWTT